MTGTATQVFEWDVVYCVRHGVIRIISARKANRREVIRHEHGPDKA